MVPGLPERRSACRACAFPCFRGRAPSRGLTIANPEGFSKANALEIGEMHVAINAASVLTDTVEISRVEIRSPHVLYEAGARGTNLQTIARHAGAEEKREAKAENAQKAEGKTGAGKKVVIRELIISDGRATMALSGLGGATMVLPEIRLTNIGRDSGGVSFAEAAEVVLDVLLKTTSRVASSGAVEGVVKDAGKAVEGVADELKKGLGSLIN